MMTKPHLEVHIPDHEVLRKIGGGAYGEVWLARGVTGAWRAVKVVWREDFDDERGFEREFDGILQYEPLSRNHPGLVNILHVGRSKEDQDTFYYYVMELGDDYHTGTNINPVEYEARTLRSDLITADGDLLDLDFCMDVAIRLSEALSFLHEKGLAHRDVKPSNIIFVGGKAKLADIGLVAPRDQRTFVGTEGFVPPEGPGSAQADLYSLGKVLYEMMTGKDRLQFPELPDELPSGDKRKVWLEMNRIICDICEPKHAKRTITTAEEFSHTVQRLQQGKRLRKVRTVSLLKSVLLITLLFILGFGLQYIKSLIENSNSYNLNANLKNQPTSEIVPEKQPENNICAIKVITTPSYAKVIENGILLDDVTPTEFREFVQGDVVKYRFELDGYRFFEKEYKVPYQDIFVINEKLAEFRPPRVDEPWIGPFDIEYQPRGAIHISGFIQTQNYSYYRRSEKLKKAAKSVQFSESGDDVKIVLLKESEASQYVAWLEKKARKEGLLKDDQMLDFVQEPDLAVTGYTAADRNRGMHPTRCIVKKIAYASIMFYSNPEGARIYLDDEWIGVTPLEKTKLRPKKVRIELRADGYQKYNHNLELADNEKYVLNSVLIKNNGVIFGSKWKNSIGMIMMPVRDGLMASKFETQVKDYNLFTQATKHRPYIEPGFTQEPNHPVVGVNRNDAIEFCKWLTTKERISETISENHRYKIPTDYEWSELVNLSEDIDQSPSMRDYKAQNDPQLADNYFWGNAFPPNEASVNIADRSAAKAAGVPLSKTVIGYDDGFEKTSPVGSFPGNIFGIHDLCGNVYEWMENDYREKGDLAVVRGGSWASFKKNELRNWSRFYVSKSIRDNQYGFRIILVDESKK